jgi:signal transduction histidine kinase
VTEPTSIQRGERWVERIRAFTSPAFAVDAGGRLLAVSLAARRLWNQSAANEEGSAAELLPMTWLDGSAISSAEHPARQLLEGNPFVAPCEVLVCRQDGVRLPALLSVSPLSEGVALCHVHPLEDRRERSRFLLEAGKKLGVSLDLDESLEQLRRVVLPDLADWCIVSLADPQGRLRRTSVMAAYEEDAAIAEQLTALGAKRRTLVESSYRTGKPELVAEVLEEVLRGAVADEEELRLLLAMKPRSGLSVPLYTRDRRVGAMSLLRSRHPHRFELADVEMVQELGARLAQTIDHADLYRESQEARAHSERLADRLAVLATGSSLLVEAGLDFTQACRDVVRLACEHLGDACILTVSSGPDEPQQPMAVDHRVPRHRRLLEEIVSGGAPGQGIGLAQPVYESGRAYRVPVIEPEMLEGVTESRPHLARYLREVGMSSLLVVPLRVEGRLLGTVGMTRDAGGAPYTLEDEMLLQELADRVALHYEKDRLHQEAQEALQLRDSFLSVASHELRTPLSTIRLQAQTLLRQVRRGAVDLPPAAVRRVESIDSQIVRLGTLVEELLDVSRITSGRMTFDWEEIDLPVLAREVADRFAESMMQAGCAFTFEADRGIVGRWDRSRLDQVLTNLISNAIKYGKGQPIAMRVGAADGRARVHIEDRGMGIAPEDQERIFERFERAVSSQKISGLGLGLWITRQIVVALGGEIAVQSELGKGSRFTVELPIDGSTASA